MSETELQKKRIDALQKEINTLKVGIPPMPDHIFKYRKNRTAPAQDVWGAGGTVSYIPQNAEYIAGKGNFVYYYKCPFPSKTVAPVESIYAISVAKRFTISCINFIVSLKLRDMFTKRGRGNILTNILVAYNDTADMTMLAWYLKDEYYCPLSKEVLKFVKACLLHLGVAEHVAQRTGDIVACFFEYDNAYRTRPQDLSKETSNEQLLANFPEELLRLTKIQAERETIEIGGKEVVRRFERAITILRWLWRIPLTRNALKAGINATNIENIHPDEADIYHTLLYGDYNFGGKTLAERIAVLQNYHGMDELTWPPRILIKNAG